MRPCPPPTMGPVRWLIAVSALLLASLSAEAAIPAAPSGLSVFVTKSNASYYTYVLLWTDNSTDETSFPIGARLGTSGAFTTITSGSASSPASATGGTGTSFTWTPYTTGTVLQFQVSASNASGTSAASNIVTYTVPADAFVAPTMGTMTAISESVINVPWTDNSTTEDGEELELSSDGGTTYTKLTDVLFYQAKSLNITGLEPAKTYKARLRAYKEGTPRTYTAYSAVGTATTQFKAPTSLAASVTGENAVNLTWVDNSSVEGGYAVYYKPSSSGSYTLYGYTTPNATSQALSGLTAGTSYDFQVAAAYQSTSIIESARSNTATVTTKDGFTSRTYQPITFNQSFSYQAVVSTGSSRSSWNITGLPTGLSFNSSTGLVSGIPTVTGVFVCPMTATFANGWTSNSSLTLRIIRAPGSPITGTTITTQTLANGGNTSVSLTDKFSDPDAESAVRIATNLGTMDFILYNTATPQTVTNFLSYVNGSTSSKNYNGAVFHRSIPGFIVQGGAFKVQSAPNNFTSIITSASPTNEPGISNLRGTVAMAKLGTDPNSATDQFFVNLADNSSNLDNQNGGFTAFARVAGNGMAVADAMAALPTVNSSVNIDGSPTTSLTDWPLTSSSASMDTSKVVTITSAAPVAVLSYSVTGNTNPTAVSASISGTNVQINGLAGGQSDVTVTATDLDGNTITQTFTVNVNQAPAFTSSAPTSPAVKNVAYNFVCTASGFPAPTFSVTAGGLPTGLTLASDGTISGTPSATGTFTGTITATNSVTTATQNFSITVNEVPAFTNGPPASTGLKGTTYTFTYTASGVPAPTFSVTAGALPTGLTLASNGAITGTPNTAGTFTGTVTATNTAGTATQNFSITINETPAFTSSAPTSSAVVGTAYNFTCTASGSPAPTFAITAGGLPSGLSITPNGAITGTPNAGGTFTGTITATNTVGTANQNFSITVTVTLNNWAASKGLSGADALPSADPDHDGRTNLQEFAFMTEPNAADDGAVPSYALATPGGIGYGEITFPVRKFAPSLTYTVEASDSLTSGTWSPLWTTADGFGAAVVRSAVDQADRTILTVRDTQASPPATRRFLRVTVTTP